MTSRQALNTRARPLTLPQKAYNDIATAGRQYADGKIPEMDTHTTATAVWGLVYESFKLGARFGYRLAKAKK